MAVRVGVLVGVSVGVARVLTVMVGDVDSGDPFVTQRANKSIVKRTTKGRWRGW